MIRVPIPGRDGGALIDGAAPRLDALRAALAAADVVTGSILAALDLLIDPTALAATLRA